MAVNRYSLRNQGKISDHYNQDFVNQLNNSLKELFNSDRPIKTETREGEPYPILIVNDIESPVITFAFYHYQTTYDVYNLAFKEVVK